MRRLLVILVRLIVDDVEEAKLIYALGGGNDTEPVTELLLLEELLSPIHALACVSKASFPQQESLFVLCDVCRRTGTSSSGRRTLGEQ